MFSPTGPFSKSVRRGLTLASALVVLVPISVAAQDEFDREFDSEFDATSEPPAEPDDSWEEAFRERERLEEDLAEEADREQLETDLDEAAAEARGDIPEEYRDPRDDPRDRRRRELFPLWLGGTGGMHLADGRGMPAGNFQLQIGIDFFRSDGFLEEDDGHGRIGGTLSLAWAPLDTLELHLSSESYANSNLREFPNLMIVLADIRLGAKLSFPISDLVALAGDLTINAPTSGDLGLAARGLGFTLSAIASADLRELEDPIPLQLRASLGYTLDRSANLIEADEDLRYSLLEDALPREDEVRHYISRVERTGLNISRTDFLEIGLGADAPIRVREDILLAPTLEWRMRIPVNRQGYDCPFVPDEPGGDTPADGQDSCLDRVGIAAMPSTLTLGLRARPIAKGFSAFLALDIGLTGTNRDSAVRELPLNAPWRLMFGVGYLQDTRAPVPPPPIERPVDVEVEVQMPPAPRGRISGRVRVALSSDAPEGSVPGTPVPNATIHFLSHDRSALVSDDAGNFVTYAFEPANVVMEVRAPGFETGRCEAEITLNVAGQAEDVEVLCLVERRALVQVEEEAVVILEQIQFAFDSAEILPESFELMGQIAEALRTHEEIRRVEIQGHTSDEGNDDYNAQLSQRRAESVMAWLTEAGIASARLRAVGYGETRPLMGGESEEARTLNRRVEFRIEERAP